jgi:SpoVK/Ycf46/Vps4 family AAA+-type ATPase
MPNACPDQQRLERLILSARHPCVFIPTHEESYALNLVRHAALGTKEPFWIWTVLRGVHPGLFEDAKSIPNSEHPAAALHHFAHQMTEPSICAMLDVSGHLQDERTLRSLRETIAKFRQDGGCLVLIDHADQLPGVIQSDATRFELSLPDEEELERLIRDTVKRLAKHNPVHASISRRDLKTIIRNLAGLPRRAAERIIADCVAEDAKFSAEDVNAVLAHKRKHLQADGVLEYVEAPVDLEQIGGLAKLKRWLKHREAALSEEAREFGLEPPRGVLLLGVQGAGKSLSAKAIATAWQRPLLRLDPGALYDRFVGESEKRLRDALHQAEMMSPIVLWIDEIEKGFASAASQSTDGGLSQRMFGTLLTWMQEHEKPVFLVATANDIDALPPELLRKGRFDEIFFVDLPDEKTRRQIFEIHLRKRRRDPAEFDVSALAAASNGFSGAEIEQAVIAALHEAFAEKGEIDTNRIVDVLSRSPPLSVTAAERIAMLREWAKDRCVPAD